MEVKPGYKQTEVGVIPEDWELRDLLGTLRIANGQVDPRQDPFRSMILVAPDHIERGTGKLLERRTAAEQGAISGKYRFNAGDIVYSKIRPYLRKAILADFDGLCSADMYPLKPIADVVAGFMLPVLLGHRFTRYAESVSIRTGMPKINRAEMAEFVVALPSKLEQRAIAKALSDVDALMGRLDRIIAKKRDLKQAAMQQLLTGQTRLPGFHSDWQVKTLGEIASVKTGPFGSLLHEGDYVEHGTPIITVEHLGEFGVRHFNLPLVADADRQRLRAYALEIDDIVFSRVGSVDRNALIRSAEVGWLFSGRLLRVRTDKTKVYAPFLSHQFHTEGFTNSVRNVAVGQTMASLNTKILKAITVFVPTIVEQTAIAEVLTDMDVEIAALEQQREKTRALKQAMMQELLTGKTRLI
jgi:type I restriction enzyme, S subunit